MKNPKTKELLIIDILVSTRTRSPLLRSYQFVYPQSFETFYQLHLKLDATAAREFINKCYQEPVMAQEIMLLAR